MGRARFWELVAVGLLIILPAALVDSGVSRLSRVLDTEPGVIVGALTLIVIGLAGSIVGIGAVIGLVRDRLSP